MKFFVSYNGRDRSWAEWVAWQLEDAGYSTVIQAWDFRPGENFVLEMHRASIDTDGTIIILSENYLGAEYTHSEWAAAFTSDPRGKRRRLVPVRIDNCEVEGLLGAVIAIDLVGKNEGEAGTLLLEGVSREGRIKPTLEPGFPGRTAGEKPHFPGYPDLEERIHYLDRCISDLQLESRIRLGWVLALGLVGAVFAVVSLFYLPASVKLPISLGGGGFLSTLSGYPLKDLSPLKRRLRAYRYLADGYRGLQDKDEPNPNRKRELDQHFDRLIEMELGTVT